MESRSSKKKNKQNDIYDKSRKMRTERRFKPDKKLGIQKNE